MIYGLAAFRVFAKLSYLLIKKNQGREPFCVESFSRVMQCYLNEWFECVICLNNADLLFCITDTMMSTPSVCGIS